MGAALNTFFYRGGACSERWGKTFWVSVIMSATASLRPGRHGLSNVVRACDARPQLYGTEHTSAYKTFIPVTPLPMLSVTPTWWLMGTASARKQSGIYFSAVTQISDRCKYYCLPVNMRGELCCGLSYKKVFWSVCVHFKPCMCSYYLCLSGDVLWNRKEPITFDAN